MSGFDYSSRVERDYQDDRDYWTRQDREDDHAPAPTRRCADCGIPPWSYCRCQGEDDE